MSAAIMADDISNIGLRLEKLVPRLGSSHDGEIVATAEAIRRALAAVGLDWHDLARAIAAYFNPPRRSARHGARRYPVSDAIHAGLREIVASDLCSESERDLAASLSWHACRFAGLTEKQHALAVDLIERLRRRAEWGAR